MENACFSLLAKFGKEVQFKIFLPLYFCVGCLNIAVSFVSFLKEFFFLKESFVHMVVYDEDNDEKCLLFPQVCVRMKQYKDELLAACLMFILSLHPDMVAMDIKAYIPALQVRK